MIENVLLKKIKYPKNKFGTKARKEKTFKT